MVARKGGGLAARAAVLQEFGGAFSIETLSLLPPRADEVLVRVVATGVCHTDALVRAGQLPCPVPIVLGHEGAGVVEAIGTDVTKVVVGDHVVLSFDRCGACGNCEAGRPASCAGLMDANFRGARVDGSHALVDGERTIHDRFFGQSSFATHAIANQRNVVPIARDVPLELMGPLGCGVLTGAGSVLNVLDVRPGNSIAIFGAGGVGLAAVMAARAAGAAAVIAVDLIPSRLDTALAVGATHVVNAGECDVPTMIAELTGGGTQHALDTTGRPNVIAAAVRALSPGGCCALVSGGGPDSRLDVDANDFIVHRKRLVGVMEGDADPDAFIPKLVDLYREGRLPLERLVEFFPLDHIEDAFAAAESGRVIKPVIVMEPGS